MSTHPPHIITTIRATRPAFRSTQERAFMTSTSHSLSTQTQTLFRLIVPVYLLSTGMGRKIQTTSSSDRRDLLPSVGKCSVEKLLLGFMLVILNTSLVRILSQTPWHIHQITGRRLHK
ncbi:hypothetical protein KEM48_007304 [Puccinia striiformis f. sp. tritici PST-130]|nr:hypothetical protein KEM48_007304 [Puccinia striiformis f. sp. tritici PST-130]